MKIQFFREILLGLVSAVVMTQTSCTKSQLAPRSYMSWIENESNGLKTTRVSGDFKFSLQYKPLEYVVMLNERNTNMDKATMEKEMEEIKDMQYYTLKINSNDEKAEMLRTNLSETNEYYRRIEYFSFHLKNDVYLIDGTDSLPCGLFHFERGYGISPDNNFLLAFPLSKKEIELRKQGKKYFEEKTLIYKDRFLNTGTVRLEIKKNALENIPAVRI